MRVIESPMFNYLVQSDFHRKKTTISYTYLVKSFIIILIFFLRFGMRVTYLLNNNTFFSGTLETHEYRPPRLRCSYKRSHMYAKRRLAYKRTKTTSRKRTQSRLLAIFSRQLARRRSRFEKQRTYTYRCTSQNCI